MPIYWPHSKTRNDDVIEKKIMCIHINTLVNAVLIIYSAIKLCYRRFEILSSLYAATKLFIYFY